MQGRATQPSLATLSGAQISVLIVDDEALARDELAYLLKEFPDIEVVATGSNGLEAVRLIEDLEPDVVFLDVNMPGLDGLGVIQRLREKQTPLPHFILATAHDNYAVDAFRLDAADYLLKPVEKDRLALTIERARKLVADRVAPAEAPALVSQPRAKLLVRKDSRNFVVDASDMIYATINDGLISISAASLEGLSSYATMDELQASLDPAAFWRVHRSWIVNINRIREVVPWFKSSFQLRMDDRRQTEVPVSRVQTKRLRSLFRL